MRESVAKVDTNKISQADLDKKVAELDAAMKELEQHVLDRTALADAIARAKALAPEGYTEDSWKKLEDALADAEDAQAATSITQDELDQAAEALTKAIDGLEKESTDQPDPDKPGQGGSEDEGQGGSGSESGNGSDSQSGSGNAAGSGNGKPSGSGSGLAQTGDPAAIAGALAGGGFITALAGLFRRRKR